MDPGPTENKQNDSADQAHSTLSGRKSTSYHAAQVGNFIKRLFWQKGSRIYLGKLHWRHYRYFFALMCGECEAEFCKHNFYIS